MTKQNIAGGEDKIEQDRKIRNKSKRWKKGTEPGHFQGKPLYCY